jgi:hypothetical protein
MDFALQAANMNSAVIDLSFPHAWEAEILQARPLILPPRHYVYPSEVEEVERGALEVRVRPHGAQPFLATCALGFHDAAVPTGVWSAPNADEICAVSGGYAYLIDRVSPERFTFVPYRPVMRVMAAVECGLLLFVGHRTILARGRDGQAWESAKLSDEGVTVTGIDGNVLRGLGWSMFSDKEEAISLDLQSGTLVR